MKEKIKVIIADDHEIFRDGMSLMLTRQKNIHLVAEAADGKQLVCAAREHNSDVILTDIKMPFLDGIEATKLLVDAYPEIKIIALSMYDEENLIADMLDAGAKGYLLKNADKDEILEAITSVYKGETYYCRHTSLKLASLIVKTRSYSNQKTELINFNQKEKEIIKLICEENTTQQISNKLFISRRTVEGYRTKILEKINAKNIAGIVLYAFKNGIISDKNN